MASRSYQVVHKGKPLPTRFEFLPPPREPGFEPYKAVLIFEATLPTGEHIKQWRGLTYNHSITAPTNIAKREYPLWTMRKQRQLDQLKRWASKPHHGKKYTTDWLSRTASKDLHTLGCAMRKKLIHAASEYDAAFIRMLGIERVSA